ncbi:MAG: hypothetical protein K9L70_11130, partial [Thiohalocapsa sp.]|nr:hypothetical protein [Thiohalocapsa sp.]
MIQVNQPAENVVIRRFFDHNESPVQQCCINLVSAMQSRNASMGGRYPTVSRCRQRPSEHRSADLFPKTKTRMDETMLRKLFIAGVGLTAAGSAVALDLNYAGTDYGTFIGRVRAMSILAAEENGWDPSSGNSYSLMGRYISPTWNGFSFAAAAYLNGDIFGTTDFDPEVGKERTARGMFLADEGEQKGQLNAVGVTYRSENVYAFAGRDQIDTPLTKNTYNHVPNSYTALRVGAKPIKGLDISLSQITQMSFGTRAMTDFGFIGEATGTAGAAQLPSQDGLGQAEFLNLGQIALGPNADDIAGLTVASVVY